MLPVGRNDPSKHSVESCQYLQRLNQPKISKEKSNFAVVEESLGKIMVVEPRIFVLQSYLFSISMHVIFICAHSSNAFALVTITQ